MNEQTDVAQTSKQRKDAIKKARAAHHKAQTEIKQRLDVYIEDETKDALKQIKAQFEDVKNEGQAVDKAVQIAIDTMTGDELGNTLLESVKEMKAGKAARTHHPKKKL